VILGPPYRDEMFAFIASGQGRESDPARFVPQHLLHAGIFAVVTLASGGLLGLFMARSSSATCRTTSGRSPRGRTR
jgi:hypothetical protein